MSFFFWVSGTFVQGGILVPKTEADFPVENEYFDPKGNAFQCGLNGHFPGYPENLVPEVLALQ